MSFWSDVLETLRQSAPLTFFSETRDPRNTVTFTIAMIGLGAKLAKADGRVTVDEVTAFRQIFHFEADQERNVARVFNMLRRDVAGYREYAHQIVRLFGERDPILEDIIDALFHISMADGVYHPDEDTYLWEVAQVFGLTPACFRKFKARYVPDFWDAHAVLGVDETMSPAEIRDVWRDLVRQNHPDRLRANGLPDEMMELANRRIADINRAYDEISGKVPVA
ncbi:MAG: DnaJ family molecular chaperone [Pseudomonadota bacterium]